MFGFLKDIFKAEGIESYEQLNEQEVHTMDNLTRMLGMPDPTMDDIRKWIREERDRATRELYEYTNDKDKDLYFKCMCRMLDKLELYLGQPKKMRDYAIAEIKRSTKAAKAKNEQE